ncbi:hypothetical protein LWI29_037101 [Acer saccharum]|uniref:Uncharacterized protein n=1 Tax=Acer saccharum TaxID=4024 RepID=A0AA39VL95_ACESA|nr:hypothetical protein LWI29_037101 [Acer saccharum]
MLKNLECRPLGRIESFVGTKLEIHSIGEANIEGGVPTNESALHHHLVRATVASAGSESQAGDKNTSQAQPLTTSCKEEYPFSEYEGSIE